MPMYEYRCNNCGAIYEKLKRARDADRNLECPDCKSADVQRMISAFATSGDNSVGSCGPSAGGAFR